MHDQMMKEVKREGVGVFHSLGPPESEISLTKMDALQNLAEGHFVHKDRQIAKFPIT